MRETRILYELKTHHIAFAMAYLVLYRHSHTKNARALKLKQTVQQAIIREVQRNTQSNITQKKAWQQQQQQMRTKSRTTAMSTHITK